MFSAQGEVKRHAQAYLCLDVECDQAVRHQVVDGLKPLLSHKVFTIVIKAEVSGLVAEPEGKASSSDLVSRLKLIFLGHLHFALV